MKISGLVDKKAVWCRCQRKRDKVIQVQAGENEGV